MHTHIYPYPIFIVSTLSEKTEKRSYEDILASLPDVDIFVIKEEIGKRDNRIAELTKTNKGLFTLISEYYNNINVLGANSERILAAVKQVKPR